MNTASGLTQAFLGLCTNKAATIRGLENRGLCLGILIQKTVVDGAQFKGHDMQDWAKEHDMNGGSISSITCEK